MRSLIGFLLALSTCAAVAAENPTAASADWRVAAAEPMKWIAFPHPHLELRGLPWFEENAPELWRLPKSAKARVPNGVWNRAVAPDGGRIRFRSATSRLAIRVEVIRAAGRGAFFDAFVDDRRAGSASVKKTGPTELVLLADSGREQKNITIYLPNTSEVRVLAIGIDENAKLERAPEFALKAPIVCYGSSVLQGTGADHPAQTYPAIVARRLNLDFINLGFGGAGKAEPAVVALVNHLDACCYLFDLGKSYGNQTKEPFVAMLASVRAAHPTVPIVCVTPIYSTKEIDEPDYRQRSVDLRDMMRAAALERRASGDTLTFVVEGLELFGPDDKALFRDPQHPNDEGNERIGDRLAPVIRSMLSGGK